jgi:hypothetical protein
MEGFYSHPEYFQANSYVYDSLFTTAEEFLARSTGTMILALSGGSIEFVKLGVLREIIGEEPLEKPIEEYGESKLVIKQMVADIVSTGGYYENRAWSLQGRMANGPDKPADGIGENDFALWGHSNASIPGYDIETDKSVEVTLTNVFKLLECTRPDNPQVAIEDLTIKVSDDSIETTTKIYRLNGIYANASNYSRISRSDADVTKQAIDLVGIENAPQFMELQNLLRTGIIRKVELIEEIRDRMLGLVRETEDQAAVLQIIETAMDEGKDGLEAIKLYAQPGLMLPTIDEIVALNQQIAALE